MNSKTCALCESPLEGAVYKCSVCNALTPAGLDEKFPEYAAHRRQEAEALEWIERATRAEERIKRALAFIKQTQKAPPHKGREWAWAFRQVALGLEGAGYEGSE